MSRFTPEQRAARLHRRFDFRLLFGGHAPVEFLALHVAFRDLERELFRALHLRQIVDAAARLLTWRSRR